MVSRVGRGAKQVNIRQSDLTTAQTFGRGKPEEPMKQPHTEATIRHTGDKEPGAPHAKGADRFGGTRAGQENVELSDKEKPRPAGAHFDLAR